jgi:uncharacterized lipoprotein
VQPTKGIRRPARAGLLFLLALAAVAAACESEKRLSKSEYERVVSVAYAPVQAAFEATRGSTTAVLAGKIAAAQAELRGAAERLEEVEPPEEVEKQNEELVEGMRAYAGDLGRLLAALHNGDTEAVVEFNREIGENKAVEQMAEAAEEMKFKGYDLGPIAEE